MNDDRIQKVLAIGLDAAEWTLVEKWAGEGKLPAFARLLERGASGTLTSTCNQFPDTVWSCIYSGRNPATFEKYFYVAYDPKTGGLRHVGDDAFTKAPFWQILSDAGRKVGVVDAVKYPASTELNGFQIANWGAHATKVPRASVPPELWDEVCARIGEHPVGDVDKMDGTVRGQLDMRERLLTGVRRHGELHRWLMREREWDVYYASFSETHQVGHFFWHLMDATHPRHPADDPHGLEATVERVYKAIDAEVGAMVDAAGDGTLCLVFAGHGMGPLYHASWNLPEILDLCGYGKGPARRAAAGEGARPARINPWRILKMVLPGKLQYAIKGMLPQSVQDWLVFRWYAGKFDPAGRRAFSVPSNDAVGLIRLGVRGRDPGGVVEPGDYGTVCRELAAALGELSDPVSGKPVVAEVSLVHERFEGEFLDDKPDIAVMWETGFPWHAIHSPRFGTLSLKNQDSRSGSHTPHGFFVAAGPGVPHVRLEGHSIYDICPTILAAAGVDVPDGLDGAALPILGGAVRV